MNNKKIEVLKSLKNDLIKEIPSDVKTKYIKVVILTTTALAAIGISRTLYEKYVIDNVVIEQEDNNSIGLFNTADIPYIKPAYEKEQKKVNALKYKEKYVKE